MLRCQPESGSLWCHWSSFGPASSSDHSDQAVHDVHGSYRAQILKQTEMWLKMTETYYAYYAYLCCVPWCHHPWVLHVVPRRHAVLSLHCPDRIHFIAENTASVLLLATRHYQLGLYPANYSEELASKTQRHKDKSTTSKICSNRGLNRPPVCSGSPPIHLPALAKQEIVRKICIGYIDLYIDLYTDCPWSLLNSLTTNPG